MKLTNPQDAPGPSWQKKLQPLFDNLAAKTERVNELNELLKQRQEERKRVDTAVLDPKKLATALGLAQSLDEIIERIKVDLNTANHEKTAASRVWSTQRDALNSHMHNLQKLDKELETLQAKRDRLYASLTN